MMRARLLCRYIKGKALPGGRNLPFALDTTARQLRDPAYVGAVLAALAEAGLSPDRLELEISGTEPPGEAMDQLRALTKAGVRIALDAAVTRGATLGALRAYPIARLTADHEDRPGLELARAVTALTHAR